MSTATVERTTVRATDPETGKFFAFTPVRVYHLRYPGVTFVDRGIKLRLKENKDYDPAEATEYTFFDSIYQAKTPEALAAVLRIGGPDVAVEDLPEGADLECPWCKRTTLCRKWFAVHVPTCTAQSVS